MPDKYESIKVTASNNSTSEEFQEHPAFGLISISRRYRGDSTLFGSSIEHDNVISLTVKHAINKRALSNDWYYGKGKIVEVEMSLSQFSECITSMNVGDGIPCTIRYTEKDGNIPRIERNPSKQQQFMEEFVKTIERAMETAQQQIDELQVSLDSKKNFGVKDKTEMMSKLMKIKQEIGCNLDYCANAFAEQMDKTVTEGKGEIEAFYQNKLNSLALSALAEQNASKKQIANPIPNILKG